MIFFKNKSIIDMTQESLEKIWIDRKKEIKYNFGLRLYQYAMGKVFDCSKTTLLPSDSKERSVIIESIRGKRRSSSISRQFQRLLIGFYGISINLTPSRCGISSKKANRNNSSTVNDHVIGVTSSADYVIRSYCKDFLEVDRNASWDKVTNQSVISSVDKMANNWLKDHLWLWVQCRITKDEHKGSNLSRGTSDSIEYKKNFLHYKKAGIKVEKYI